MGSEGAGSRGGDGSTSLRTVSVPSAGPQRGCGLLEVKAHWGPRGHPVLSLSVGTHLHILSNFSSAAPRPPDAGSVKAVDLASPVCRLQLQKGRGFLGRRWTRGPGVCGRANGCSQGLPVSGVPAATIGIWMFSTQRGVGAKMTGGGLGRCPRVPSPFASGLASDRNRVRGRGPGGSAGQVLVPRSPAALESPSGRGQVSGGRPPQGSAGRSWIPGGQPEPAAFVGLVSALLASCPFPPHLSVLGLRAQHHVQKKLSEEARVAWSPRGWGKFRGGRGTPGSAAR